MLPSKASKAWTRAAEHPLTTVFVLALCVRLINLALLTGRDAFFAEQDAFGYWALGAALAKPDTFWPTLLSLTDRMPLYLLLLAGVQHAFGDVPRVVALVQAVIDAGTCTFIAALGALISPLTGLIAGILLATGASYLARGLLFGINGVDGISFSGVSCLFLLIAMLASYPPARRAMRVDPMVALRYE